MLWKKFLIAHPERLLIQDFAPNCQWFVPEDPKEISEIITTPHHPYWNIAFGYERMDRDFSSYDALRNIPSVDGSTRLSPYIRFGVFSIREVYRKFVPESSPPEKGESEGVTQKGILSNVTHPNPPLSWRG